MIQIALSVFAGLVGWVVVWFGSEKLLSAIWPEGFGAHQRAFQAAIENHTKFTANTKMLLAHLVLGAIVSALAGFVTALIAGENTRAPLILACLLLALGILKAVMSWRYTPIWYQVIFTALLVPMTVVGGTLYAAG